MNARLDTAAPPPCVVAQWVATGNVVGEGENQSLQAANMQLGGRCRWSVGYIGERARWYLWLALSQHAQNLQWHGAVKEWGGSKREKRRGPISNSLGSMCEADWVERKEGSRYGGKSLRPFASMADKDK